MDIDTLMLRMRELAKNIIDNDGIATDDALELATGFENMDQWISRGGYLPASWQIGQKKNN